jgi:hypothetical protein
MLYEDTMAQCSMTLGFCMRMGCVGVLHEDMMASVIALDCASHACDWVLSDGD